MRDALGGSTQRGMRVVTPLHGPNPRPLPRLADLILGEAVRSGAEQIHLDAASGTVRYYRSGSWDKVLVLPRKALDGLVNRIRVIASLDRTGGKREQERELRVLVDDVSYTVRVVVRFTQEGTEESYLHLRRS